MNAPVTASPLAMDADAVVRVRTRAPAPTEMAVVLLHSKAQNGPRRSMRSNAADPSDQLLISDHPEVGSSACHRMSDVSPREDSPPGSHPRACVGGDRLRTQASPSGETSRGEVGWENEPLSDSSDRDRAPRGHGEDCARHSKHG